MAKKSLHSIATDKQYVPTSRQIPDENGSSTAVTMVGSQSGVAGARKLKEYDPDALQRERISRIVTNLGKSAVDYAFNTSVKGIRGGMRAYKSVKEGLGVFNPSHPSSGKEEDITLSKQEMQERIQKMQEDMNDIKQQFKTTLSTKELESFKKLPSEPVKESSNTKNEVKKVFIRSRL